MHRLALRIGDDYVSVLSSKFFVMKACETAVGGSQVRWRVATKTSASTVGTIALRSKAASKGRFIWLRKDAFTFLGRPLYVGQLYPRGKG